MIRLPKDSAEDSKEKMMYPQQRVTKILFFLSMIELYVRVRLGFCFNWCWFAQARVQCWGTSNCGSVLQYWRFRIWCSWKRLLVDRLGSSQIKIRESFD